MLFERVGLIFNEPAQLPTIEDRNEFIRIYYSFRIKGQSHINYFEIKKSNFKTKYRNKKPVLSPGPRGTFDDAGVMPSCVVKGKMYYTGWRLGQSVPYGHGIGECVFNENKNKFEKIQNGPIIGLNKDVPYLANSPFVFDKKMIFCNGTGWVKDFPTYGLWLAEKNKENYWIVKDCIFNQLKTACSRPFVFKDSIVFSKKLNNKNYEIYCLKNKKIKKAFCVSESGGEWDSDMVCYPYFYENLMFYNGNGYGKSGIGVAKCL